MGNRLKSPLILAVLVVLMLSVGVAGAGRLITGKQIKNHSITGKDIRRGSIPLSALKSVPNGSPGSDGAKGDPGPQGNPGVVGATGPAGPAAVSRVGTLDSPIAASIAPSASPQFIGEPSEAFLASGYRGAVEATVTIGTTSTTIDDPSKFNLGICVDSGFGPEPIETEEGGRFGISPVMPSGERLAVAVSSGFFVGPGEEEIFPVLFGACVLNETTSALDANDRAVGFVLAASPAS